MHVHELIGKVGLAINPTFAQWATSSSSTASSKKCYETLETYGDTILKLAATLLAYNYFSADTKATESKLAKLKDSVVTNQFLEKFGRNLCLFKYMRTKDPEPKDWSPPFTK